MKVTAPERSGGYVILVVMAVMVLLPLVSVLSVALQPSGTLVSGLNWPKTLNFSNFADAWNQAGFGHLFLNSILLCACVVPLSLVAASLAGFGLGTLRPRGGNAIFGVFLAGLVIPGELIIIPLFYDLRAVGLLGSYAGAVLAVSAGYMPFGVLWMKTQFEALPSELVEAARIDGANAFQVFWRIQFPLVRGGLSTLSVLFFMWTWNQFLLLLILIQNPVAETATSGLGAFQGRYTTDIPLLAAACLIIIIPISLVFLFFQRQFIQGLTQGSTK